MVKENTQTTFIPGCTVKDFFEILYADASAARAFHREVDRDENTKVEAWNGNVRTVYFTMPMKLPGVIKKLIGSESIPVREVQRAETDSNGGLLVTSIPQIGVPGGSKFQAVAKLSVSNGTDAGTFGCKVEATVVCTASGPWGLTGMIEGIMVEQSITSVHIYLTFCRKRCHNRLAEKGQETAVEGQQSPRSDATVFEQFFDAQEMLSRSNSMNSTISDVGASLGPSTGEVIDTVALLKLLECLEGRVGLITSDLAAARAIVTNPVKPDPVANGGPPSAWEDSFQAMNRGGTGGGRLAFWLLGVSCGAGVVLLSSLWRRRHSSGMLA